MSMKIVEYKDAIAFHPGQYIGELIEDYQMRQNEFAEKLDLSPTIISKLVSGQESISNEIAQKLEKLTNVSMQTWLKLQNAYDVKMAKLLE